MSSKGTVGKRVSVETAVKVSTSKTVTLAKSQPVRGNKGSSAKSGALKAIPGKAVPGGLDMAKPVEMRPITLAVAKPSTFKPGDKVVYPGHGVGEINTIVEKTILGTQQKIFEITIASTGMKIMVPVAQAQSVGLRKVVDKKAVERVYEILRDRNFKIDTQTWNRRFREYSQKIETGSVFEIAEVLRDLSVLSNDKELSFGEKKMLDRARTLLVSEIAIAKARTHEKVIGELKEIFS